MKAQEARALTQAFVASPQIEVVWQALCLKIAARAELGHSILAYPYNDLTGVNQYTSVEQQNALEVKLRAYGYKVTHRPDPDPGHPCSRAYTEVSW